MSSEPEIKIFQDHVTNYFTLPFEGYTVFAGIQAVGGAALAYYLFEDPAYRILPYLSSAVAAVGTCNVLRIIRNASREARATRRFQGFRTTSRNRQRIMHRSAWGLATGAFTYLTNMYAFSDGLKQQDRMWMTSAAVAASGYYFTVAFIDNLYTNFYTKPFLNYCQLIFEPALIVATAAYLLHFRGHEENFLYWTPFVLIANAGFKIANRGFTRVEEQNTQKIVLLRGIELLTGGCLLAASGIALTVYTTVNAFHMAFIAPSATVFFFGAFVIFGSSTCLRRYIDMDRAVFISLCGMLTGPSLFLMACLMAKCVQDVLMVRFAALLLGGLGNIVCYKSAVNLYRLTPSGDLLRYCQRTLGPVLVLYSSLATGVCAHRMGWKFSIAFMPFIPAGMCATYKGFRKLEESDQEDESDQETESDQDYESDQLEESDKKDEKDQEDESD